MNKTLRTMEKDKLRELLDRCEEALRESESAAGEAFSLMTQALDLVGAELDGLIPVGRRYTVAIREVRERLAIWDEHLISIGLVRDPIEDFEGEEV